MSKLYTYIQGRFANQQTAELMASHPSDRFLVVKTPAAADCIVWTGGDDIDPEIYHSKIIPGTYIDKHRDAADLAILNLAGNVIKIGICRGAQLLNCQPNGGTLWQDVTDHELGMNRSHPVTDFLTGRTYELNSVHHQMMRPTASGLIIAGTKRAREKHGYESVWKREMSTEEDIETVDPEAVWYQDTSSLCYQPHPEFGHSETTEYFYELIDRFVLGNEGKAA